MPASSFTSAALATDITVANTHTVGKKTEEQMNSNRRSLHRVNVFWYKGVPPQRYGAFSIVSQELLAMGQRATAEGQVGRALFGRRNGAMG